MLTTATLRVTAEACPLPSDEFRRQWYHTLAKWSMLDVVKFTIEIVGTV